MVRNRLGVFRALLVIVLAVAAAFTWITYRDAYTLHRGFGRDMGDVLPIYAVERPYSLSIDPSAAGRLRLAIAVILVALLALGIAVARRWPAMICVGLALVATFAINVTVARIPRGHDSFVAPFARIQMEYFGDVRLVRDDPLKFIATYPKLNRRSFNGLTHHAGTHPPGGVLFLWAGDKMFAPLPTPPKPKPNALQRFFGAEDPEDVAMFRGLDEACWWAVSFSAIAVIPAFILARTIGGASAARRLLPLYLVTPNLVLFGATCMDGVFLTFTLSALAGGFVAMRRWSIWRPIVAGVLLWFAAFFTYAAVAVPVLMGAYAICFGTLRPREGGRMLVRAAIVGAVFVLCQLAAQRWLGYDMRATVEAAIRRDLEGLQYTGYESFAVWRNTSLGNLLAFTFGSGLAVSALFTVAMFARRVPWRARAFSIAFPLAMLALGCSTLFSMETERVWLFLTPAALVVATRAFRGVVLWVLVLALSITQVLLTEWWYSTYW